MTTVHVYPLKDLREHNLEGCGIGCPCHPKIEQVFESQGADEDRLVVIHNSWDGREILESAVDHAFGVGVN